MINKEEFQRMVWSHGNLNSFFFFLNNFYCYFLNYIWLRHYVWIDIADGLLFTGTKKLSLVSKVLHIRPGGNSAPWHQL